jgi:capsular exopolysaccharide synthesis family protein
MRKTIKVYQSDKRIVLDAIDKIIVRIYRKKHEYGHKAFMITGCSVGCGTTNIAVNIAVALANSGWKTVLVDCDMRKGLEYETINQKADKGLSDYLTDARKDVIYSTDNDKLDYIPCGKSIESPVRLFATPAMEDLDETLKKDYDFVIYDFPSINVVPDAEILFPLVDDVILVAAINETTKKQLEAAKSKAKGADGKYMGVIINKLDMEDFRHYVKNYDYFKADNLKKTYLKRMKNKNTEG